MFFANNSPNPPVGNLIRGASGQFSTNPRPALRWQQSHLKSTTYTKTNINQANTT
jgi:hypothetical protein